MRFIITGGGTAGHVTPLLALAEEIKKNDPLAEVRYIGQIGDSMQSLVGHNQQIERTYSIFAGKWRRYHGVSFWGHLADIKTILKNIRDGFCVVLGFVQSFFILTAWQPDVVFVRGGFVGLPVGLAAAFLKIPLVTHDSDSTPGLTNRILSRFAKYLLVSLPEEAYVTYYPIEKMRYTGVPIRKEFQKTTKESTTNAKTMLGFKSDEVVALFIGGSLGAIRLNEAIYSNLPALLKHEELRIVWICGNKQYQELTSRLKAGNFDLRRVQLFSFVENLYNVIIASDFIVSRAGATAMAEFAAVAKPVVLVPNPFLAENHQTKNAYVYSEKEAAIVLTEEELQKNPKVFIETMERLISDANLKAKLSQNINDFAVYDAATRIVFFLNEAAKK